MCSTTTTTSVCARSTTSSPYSILTTVLSVLHVFCTATYLTVFLCNCFFLLVMVERSRECPWLHYFVFEQLSAGWGLSLVPLVLPGEGFKSVIIEPRTGIWQPEGSSGGILSSSSLYFLFDFSQKREEGLQDWHCDDFSNENKDCKINNSYLKVLWGVPTEKKRASKMVHRKIVTSPRFKISNAMSPIEAAEHKIEIDRKRSQLEWWRRVKEVLRWGVLWEVRLIC